VVLDATDETIDYRLPSKESAEATSPEAVQVMPWYGAGRPAAASENVLDFQVTLQKTPGLILGLELDLLDGVHALVCGVKPGIVANYNSTAPPARAVNLLDWIVEVNGITGNAQDMHNRLKLDKTIELRVLRTETFTVQITQDRSRTFSAVLKCATVGNALLIIDESYSPLKAWSDEHPSKAVRTNDRIVEVNGMRGNTGDMMQQIQNVGDLTLVILSPRLRLRGQPPAEGI
jgi:hypothetical protein